MNNKLFEELNFSKKETRVYLALLELTSAKVSDIAKKVDLNRTSTYDILEALMRKGLISKYKKGGVIYFNALNPEHLLNFLDREKEEKDKIIEKQKRQVANFLPELISLQNIATTKPKVQFFEGEKGMREAYEDTLTAKETILAYANVKTMHEGLPNFFPEYYKRRAGKKIFINAIVPQNKLSIERSRHDQEEMRKIKFLPNNTDFSPEINLYNNKMLIASWKEKMAIIVESKELVDLQKMIFGLVWNSLASEVDL